jgi:EAL domain-containing protein (putative c-di-GMP-specific phosphodiesterase class I)/GGDEF domain-containing protein
MYLRRHRMTPRADIKDIMFPLDADSRLDALAKLVRMTTVSNECFDRVTRLTAKFFGMPIAMILLTETHHVWFKQHIGFEFGAICPSRSACADVAATKMPIIIGDLQVHPNYRTSEFAELGVRSYAGAPLVTHQGRGIGTLCVLGFEPKTATDDEVAALADFARMVMLQVELQVAFGRIDPMSGMPNRNQFLDDMADLAKNEPDSERMAVLVEIAGSDEMDQAARVMGSRYFDEIVNAAAETIIGEGRSLYHVASTQFAFLAPAGIDKSEYAAILRSRTKIQHETLFSGFILSPRIGVVEFAPGVMAPREILRRAHAAAQSARAAGEIVQFYSSADDEANARRYWILNQFKKAILSNQLHLVYQPRVDLRSGKIVSAEALVRWEHPEAGMISPAEFVPIIEGTTYVRSLTEWVVNEALGQLARWRADGSPVQLSLNISAIDLENTEFEPMLAEAIARHDIPTRIVELELTEGAVMQEKGKGLSKLRALSAMGFKLAIDDFGTGYSSLSYLQKLPVDVVKIDRSFLLDVATDVKAKTLVKAMITLCQDLGYRVVAEGIEDRETRDLLRDAGCDEAQGYFFGKPMLPSLLTAFLAIPQPLVA